MCLGSPISCWHHLLYLAPWMNGNMNKVDIFWLVGCLCNKQDNTWLLGDMESLCLYPTQYLTWELFRCTVKERFYIFTHPCIILFIHNKWKTKFHSLWIPDRGKYWKWFTGLSFKKMNSPVLIISLMTLSVNGYI